jgi:hypothetical protein
MGVSLQGGNEYAGRFASPDGTSSSGNTGTKVAVSISFSALFPNLHQLFDISIN